LNEMAANKMEKVSLFIVVSFAMGEVVCLGV
jgi:hypothetical protein